LFGCNVATRAGFVFNHYGFAQLNLKTSRNGASRAICATTGRKRHQDAKG
jgi:hypothetical protein